MAPAIKCRASGICPTEVRFVRAYPRSVNHNRDGYWGGLYTPSSSHRVCLQYCYGATSLSRHFQLHWPGIAGAIEPSLRHSQPTSLQGRGLGLLRHFEAGLIKPMIFIGTHGCFPLLPPASSEYIVH